MRGEPLVRPGPGPGWRAGHARPGRVGRWRDRVAGVAERLWRPPLVVAAVLFALSGPAHAVGRTDAVFSAALVGLALGTVAAVLGLVASRASRKEQL